MAGDAHPRVLDFEEGLLIRRVGTNAHVHVPAVGHGFHRVYEQGHEGLAHLRGIAADLERLEFAMNLHAALREAVSHHLKVLHEAGLLDRTKRATWVYYSVRSDALSDLGALIGGSA